MIHRRLVLTIAATVAVVVVAVAIVELVRDEGGNSGLAVRVEELEDPELFSFAHSAVGTEVLGCVLPNRTLFGDVDVRAGVATIRLTRDGPIVAALRGGDAFLHRSLFAGPAVDATWVRLPREAPAEVRRALVRSVGAELAGYVFAADVPASGASTAKAVLDAADTAQRIGTEAIGGASFDVYRVVLDANALSSVDGPVQTTSTGPEATTAATVDLWIGDAGVDRVRVLRGSPGAGEPAGWSIDYGPSDNVRLPRDLADAVAVGSVDPQSLRPAQAAEGCSLPL